MIDIKIREYKESDYLKFENLVFSLYSEDPEGEAIDSSKVRNTVDEFTKFPEKGKIFIFNYNNHIIGYAIIVYFWSNEFGGDVLQIDEMYIINEMRNQSIGTYFINYLHNYKSIKTKAFSVEVTPSNSGALNLYKRLGFKYSGNIHLILKK